MTLTVWPFAPAGLAGRSAEEVFAAGTWYTFQRWTACLHRVCPECTGPVDRSLHVFEEHDPPADAPYPTSGRRDEVQARAVCTVCKNRP